MSTERRQANYDLLKATKAFEPSVSPDGGCSGNISELINGDYKKKDGKYARVGGAFKDEAFYEVVSAPFLLAKLVASYAGINVQTHGQEAYKITWIIALKHKETGAIITFYDWKGSASIGSNICPSEVTDELKEDLFALVRALADPHFPHPYDGCSIGEVA